MEAQSMLERLDRYYQSQGISAAGFNCKHRASCEAVCKTGEMVSLPASYVGPEYEAGTLPRLLFVSSDTNDASWVKSQGTDWGSLKEVRQDTLTAHRSSGAKTHWGQTLNLAGALLECFAMERLGRGIDRSNVVEYIAHTKSIRCKDSSIGTSEGDNRIMPSNCREFLVGEVMALQPDIIVAQGKRAREALEGRFHVIRYEPMKGYPNTYYQIVRLDDHHTAIKIVAKHPCARGRNGWKRGEKKQFIDWAAKSVNEEVRLLNRQ